MRNQEIRNQFLTFFESKLHKIESSAPMVLKNDPTLMFTNAGMNQYKDFFLGNTEVVQTRIANSQKCLRVSGKHNDLEEVGIDTYHHTMFEMLGNWSFGDYFKEEAIAWAWELLTDVFRIPKDQIYVSIFEGDESDKLPLDEEAKKIWEKYIDPDRILAFDKKDNFWEMGDTGPCGPCSEIHVDMRPKEERAKIDGKTLVNQDDPQVIEIWNLVFMEFLRKADGVLEPLKNKHIDTGMGFERLAMVLQGKQSNYDTDIFTPFISAIESLSKKSYGKEEKIDVAMRVIADHVRAVAFSIADGQLPSNNGAGYVIRRILRRAVSYGYRFLGQEQAFVYKLVPILVNEMGAAFPELKKQQKLITQVIEEEENSFLRTLRSGLERVDKIIAESQEKQQTEISGEVVFELYDTYGFPTDLTALVAQNHGMTLDLEGYEKKMQERKADGRKDATKSTGDWVELIPEVGTEFIGYDTLETNTRIVKYRTNSSKKGKEHQVVLQQTPFYAESGGQVGDSGWLTSDTEEVVVYDTKKENDLIVHFVKDLPKHPESAFLAKINASKRDAIVKNHSATHLLHQALRSILGEHVEQRGSYVGADRLRFDFSHFSKVSDAEMQQIQTFVNGKIKESIRLNEHRELPIQQAKDMGAMALFGEKYGEKVRVVQFADSVELCGGCHVANTRDIGYFLLDSEGSVASGIRRIEALTGDVAIGKLEKDSEQLADLLTLLKNPQKPQAFVAKLLQTQSDLTKENEQLLERIALGQKSEWKKAIQQKGNAQVLIRESDLNPNQIKTLLYQLKEENAPLFAVIISQNQGKVTLSVAMDETLTEQNEALHAGKLVKTWAKEIRGGGGGQASFATAGGSDPAGVPKVLDLARSLADSLG